MMCRKATVNGRASLWRIQALLLFVTLVPAGVLVGDEFRAGAYAVDISPQKFPVLVNGGFFARTGTRVIDPLHARWLVMNDGQTEMAICVVDCCVLPRELVDKAKRAVAAETGISADRILLSATHTHSAPSLMQAHGTDCDPDYPDFLIPRLVEGAIRAKRNLVPARAGWTTVQDKEHTYCRRWIRRPDRLLEDPFGQLTVRANMHPGHCNGDVIGPAGPVDPGLTILAVETSDSRPIALLANYSMHYFGAPAVSADYYGRFAEKIAERLAAAGQVSDGPPVVGIMSQGTSGDLQWMDYERPRRSVNYDQYAEELVQIVLDAHEQIELREQVTLDMVDRDVELALRVPDDQRLAWAESVMNEFDGFDGGEPTNRPQIYAREQFFIRDNPRRKVKLQALRVGDLGITSMSAEVFGITGLKLKLQSPFTTQMNFSLANGEDGYIPPPEQHALGGYTTWAARTAGLEVDAEPKIVAELLEMLEQIADHPRRALPLQRGPYIDAVLDSQPVAYWPLDEIAGSVANDASGNEHHGVFHGGHAFFLPGPPSKAFSEHVENRCAYFAGGYLDAGTLGTDGDCSIELWFCSGMPSMVRDVTGTLLTLGDEENAPRLGISGRKDDTPGRLVWMATGEDAQICCPGATRIRPKAWYHAVLVREADRLRVFLNGNPEPDIDTRVGGENKNAPFSPLRIAGGPGIADSFEGRIDEVAVYSRALSSDEIGRHFEIAGMPLPKPLPLPQPASILTQKPRSSEYTDAILRSKPIAYWPMYDADDEAATDDVSEGENHAVFEAGAGPVQSADRTPFRGGRLSAELERLGQAWSVELWFRNSLPNTDRPVTAYLVSRGPGGDDEASGDHLGVGGTHTAAGRLFFFNGNRLNETVVGVSEVPPDTWNHVVLVREQKKVRIYLNGRADPEAEGEVEIAPGSGSADFFIGGRNDNFANLQGAVEDVSVYDRVLTPEEVADHFAAMGAGE